MTNLSHHSLPELAFAYAQAALAADTPEVKRIGDEFERRERATKALVTAAKLARDDWRLPTELFYEIGAALDTIGGTP